MKDAPIYVLNSLDPAETDWLNPLMANNLLVVSGIEQVMADPSRAAALGSLGSFDLSKIKPGTDLFAMLSQLPASTIAQISTAMNQRFETMGSSSLIQAAAAPIKAEYTALGMDAGALSNNYILNTGVLMLLLTLVSVNLGFQGVSFSCKSCKTLRDNTKR